MKRFTYPDNITFGYVIVLLLFAVYLALFRMYYVTAGIAVAALATIPVIGAGWYLGSSKGMWMACFIVLTNIVILMSDGYSLRFIFTGPDMLIGFLALVFIGWVVGSLGSMIREGRAAITKLEQYELERRAYTEFLEHLNAITGKALEADSFDSTLKILGEEIMKLFKAEDCFFSLWNEARHLPVPIAAYGSLRDVYPYVQFQPGDRTLTTSVIEAQRPLGVPDIENSPYISPEIAAIFPSRSMLGLPLIAQNRKLGALLLGYQKPRSFDENDLANAQITAEQVALVLSKSLLLEEERKQVRQLTALHDIALISIDVDNEDELINRVTDIIGQNLFPDNFGILLLDDERGILQAHPSYRFFATEDRRMMDMPIDQGITGRVARTGQPQRIANVRQAIEYIDVDDRTISELCVPIKFKERILGVINAESTKKEAFTEDDERLLITLAGQIATAMEQIHKAQAERKWLDQLAHSNDLIYALAQITTHVEKAFSIDDIIRNLGAELSKIDLTCIMAVYDKERDSLTTKYTSMPSQFVEIVENSLGYPFIGYHFPRNKLSQGNLLYPTALSDPVEEIQLLFARLSMDEVLKLLQDIGVGPEMEPLRLPLTFEENLLGVLWIWGKNLTKADLPIMSIFAKQIGVSLERARLFQEVQSLALTDPLTGLQNRRSLFELGRVEFARAKRMKRPFCCMMLDLDHFKHINDQYGHMIGDQVLQEFAKRCACSVREVDLVGRYGGEELIILLPETDRKTSIQVAERLCRTIADSPIQVFDKKISVTASIGVASQDENTTDLETLIARADQAMYIAKHKGRNCVAMSK
jgi:diguanylate cyclase (GGDEF)-like protein